MAKEIQAHMWISFLEAVVKLSGGQMTGGVTIETERVDDSSGIRLGFLLVGGRGRAAFLESTKRRMRTFTELALDGAHADREIEDAAGRLVARPFAGDADANEQVADNLRETQE